MAKVTYYYNTETCKYEKIETSIKDVVKNMLIFIFVAIILAIGLVLIYGRFFPNPEIVYLNNEKKETLDEITKIEEEFSKINKESMSLADRDVNVYRQITQTTMDKPNYKSNRELQGDLQGRRIKLRKVNELYTNIIKLNKNLITRSYAYENILNTALRKEEMLASIPAIYPVPQDQARYTSGFGYRWHPIARRRKFHDGIDLAGPIGTPIYSSGDGIVEKAKRSYRGYGNELIINHGFGYRTRYAHMKKFIVKQGQKVTRGELIGYLGNSGSSTGPHLHYEVIVNNRKVNPVAFLSKDLSADQLHEYLDVVNEEHNH